MNRRKLFKISLAATAGSMLPQFLASAHGKDSSVAAGPAARDIRLTPEEISQRLAKLRDRKLRVNPPSPEVVEALSRFPTAVLLYDLAQVEENFLQYLEAKPDLHVHYAVKSAPDARLMQRIASLGGGFDFASRNELDLALGTGVKVEKCIYSNTVKPAADIRYAFDKGVRAFVTDSEHETRKIAKNAPGAFLYVRLSVDGKFSNHPLGDKFGTTPENAKKLLRLGKELGLVPYGTHFHVGTQCLNTEAWVEPSRQACAIFRDLKKEGIDLQFFDIGGGFPTVFQNYPKVPAPKDIISVVVKILDEELPGWPVKLAAEPGRGICGTSGAVSSRVMLRADRADGEWLHLDAGLYQGLFEAMDKYVYDITVKGRNGAPQPFTLCGPTCDSFDTISKGQMLPGDIDEEDLLIFHNSAAYSEACYTHFNGMAPPAIHYLDELFPV
jgi:ornithine decarboxylase